MQINFIQRENNETSKVTFQDGTVFCEITKQIMAMLIEMFFLLLCNIKQHIFLLIEKLQNMAAIISVLCKSEAMTATMKKNYSFE